MALLGLFVATSFVQAYGCGGGSNDTFVTAGGGSGSGGGSGGSGVTVSNPLNTQNFESGTASVPSFTDVTTTAGLSGIGRTENVAWGDYNNDGYADLLVDARLYRNNGNGTFTDVTSTANLNGARLGLWGDYNNDGNLDIYFTGNGGKLYRNNGSPNYNFTDVSSIIPSNPYNVSEGACWIDFNNDSLLDLYVSNHEVWSDSTGSTPYPDIFYQQTSSGTFINAGETPQTTVWTTNRRWAGRGVTAADYNEDNQQDIYVSNYRLAPNSFWVNTGGSGQGIALFTERAQTVGAAGIGDTAWTIGNTFLGFAYPAHGHTIGSAFADLNNDGRLDLIVGNFSHPPTYQDRVQILRNQGSPNWTFEDVSSTANIPWQESYASVAAGDFDNDGSIDFILTTVYTGDQSILFRNSGGFTFQDVRSTTGVGPTETYQAGWADYDNDGDLDLFSGGRLYQNNGNSNKWVKIKLQGKGSGGTNRAAIGAKVQTSFPNGYLTRVVEGATGRGSQNDVSTVHFGLGLTGGDTFTFQVRWATGVIQNVTAAVNSVTTVVEP